MTKVDLKFRLLKPLDDEMMKRLSDANALYGINRIKVEPSLDSLTVEYDASRLGAPDVEAALAGAGVPVQPF
jgi:hypothetical protein